MAHKPTKKMLNTPHIPVLDHCRTCIHLLTAKVQDPVDWGELRNQCRCCKTGNKGIYKADAIYDLYQLEEAYNNNRTIPKRNIGKKPTRYKTHGKAVLTLRELGYSLRDIASITGIAVNTVRGILKRNDEILDEILRID